MAPRNKPCMAIKSADTVKVSPCHRVTQEKTNHESKAGTIVPFVQVSSVFVFNHLFIGCHGESPLILCFSYRGWSQSILDLICQHPLPRE